MARTKITNLGRLHVNVAAKVGLVDPGDPAVSGATFIVIAGDRATALAAVQAAHLAHGGRLDIADMRGLGTIRRRLEQAKPAYVTVTDDGEPDALSPGQPAETDTTADTTADTAQDPRP